MCEKVASILVEYRGTLEAYWKYRKGMVNGIEHVSMTEIVLTLCDRVVRGVGAEEIRRPVHVGAAALIAERHSIASKIEANGDVSRGVRFAVKEHCESEALSRIADWTRFQCSRDGGSTEEWAEVLNKQCSKQ